MTALVGYKCSDGEVLASDSMMSVGNVINYSAEKISNHEDRVLALAGEYGIGSRFREIVKLTSPHNQNYQHQLDYPLDLSRTMVDHLRSTGIDPIANPIDFAAILGYVFDNQVHCCYFLGDIQACLLDQNIYYTALGSGMIQSHPIMRLLDDSRCDNIQPTVREASLLSCWTIDRAIKTSPAGVGFDIRIATIQMLNGKVSIRMVPSGLINNYKKYIGFKESQLK